MAKRYQFGLQKVLEHRERLEDDAKQALAEAKAAHEAQARVVQDLAARLAEHIRKGAGKNAGANEMWLWRQYKEALEQDSAVARDTLGKLALKLQTCRQDVVERSKERKLLDKLKEKQAAKHHEAERLKEEKTNDEVATLRFGRKDF